MTVYVGSPVWLHVQLCYASRTHCRLRLDELPFRPHRAVTSVVVENQAATPLRLDALKLPVPHLALYGAGDPGVASYIDRMVESGAASEIAPDHAGAEPGQWRT